MSIRMLDRMNYYAPGELGKTRRVTPEGFLLCEGVAIGRTGEQLYRADEIPLEANPAGEIRIARLPEEVFREETLASFEGKPVTIEHPNEFVGPTNWHTHAVGVVQNVRRGEGIENDLVFADLLVTAADAIAYVNKSLPELSAGYESDYEQTEPGRGIQRNIVGNHVALVERGRAGPRCAINDGVPAMKVSFADRLNRFLTAFKAKDEKAMKAELESEDEEPKEEEAELKKVKDSLAQMRDEFGALKAKIKDAEEKESEEEEKKKKAKESEDTLLEAQNAGKVVDLGQVYTGDALKELIARAEILSPGLSIPTGDALKGANVISQLLLKALQTADASAAGKEHIKPFLLGRDLKTLTGDALLGVFNGAAELARVRNNQALEKRPTRDFGATGSVLSINEANRKYWAGR